MKYESKTKISHNSSSAGSLIIGTEKMSSVSIGALSAHWTHIHL